MKSLSQNHSGNPTSSRPKIVASERETSDKIRGLLAGLLRFMKRERRLPPLEGDLSSWIFSLHGFVENAPKGGNQVPGRPDEALLSAVTVWLVQIAGPSLDRNKADRAIAQTERLRDQKIAELTELYLNGDKAALDSLFREIARQLIDAWGAPPILAAQFDFSFDRVREMLRAVRATAFCLDVHKMHPLVLIARASKNDRRAVLDLVKIDKLFLHDCCTEKVIRQAEFQNDQRFIEQLARAQEYQPKLSVRTVHHLYFYMLFLIEKQRMPVPSLHELWRVLDPHGREYDSLSAFERDFQRRRSDFDQMLSAGDSQYPRRIDTEVSKGN
jgi:hypothetical protein